MWAALDLAPLLHLLHLSFDLVPVRIWFGGEGEARSPSRVGPTSAAAPHCMPDLIPPSSQSEMGPPRSTAFLLTAILVVGLILLNLIKTSNLKWVIL